MSAGFYQVNKGTFTLRQGTLTATYSEETCDPSGTETIKVELVQDGQKLKVTDGDTILFFSNNKFFTPKYHSNQNLVALQKDVNCIY